MSPGVENVLYNTGSFWYVLTIVKPDRSSALKFREAFFEQHPGAETVFELFEYLPSAYFYAKDSQHRYIGVNRATLTEVFGLHDAGELLGKTDASFQPPALVEAYHAEDRRVFEGGQTIAAQVWLVPHVRGTPRWYVSTKAPLRDPRGRLIGLAGVMYRIETPEEQAKAFRELLPVIRHIDLNYDSEISMKRMAAMAKLSTTHFNVRFREIFGMSPTQYVLSRRIEQSRRLLTSTTKEIAEVGIEVGFYDQSHFTKRFRRVTGMTPREYRQRFR